MRRPSVYEIQKKTIEVLERHVDRQHETIIDLLREISEMRMTLVELKWGERRNET